jgi:hypothetical protein
VKFGLVTLLAAVFLLSCEDGGGKNDYNPNYREPMVWGLLSKVWDDEQAVSYQKDFGVFDFDGLRMVPIVLLNDSQVEPYYYSPAEYDYGDTNVIPTNRRYDLEVRHYWGTGFCHLVMPGDFALTLPPRVPFDTFMLRQDASLLTAWSASQGAQWYWLSVYVNYDYYDTLGAWDNREFRLDTLMHDTWIIVPPQQMFPPVVREVIEGDASVTVWSGNGPPVEPGDLGNVRGAAVGFVNAINEPPSKYFYVGARRAERRAPDGRSELERFKARLHSRLPSH